MEWSHSKVKHVEGHREKVRKAQLALQSMKRAERESRRADQVGAVEENGYG